MVQDDQSEELSEYSGNQGENIGMGESSQLSATQTTPGGGTSNKRSRGAGMQGIEDEDMDNITE